MNEIDLVRTPMPHSLTAEKSVVSALMQDPKKFCTMARAEGVSADDFYLLSTSAIFQYIMSREWQEETADILQIVQHFIDEKKLDEIGGQSAIADIYTYNCGCSYVRDHMAIVKEKSVLRKAVHSANELSEMAMAADITAEQMVKRIKGLGDSLSMKMETSNAKMVKYRKRLIRPEVIQQQVTKYICGDRILGGDPFFMPDFNLAFRRHEVTIWIGHSFHGKSSAVQNQVGAMAAKGRKTCIASFEQPPEVTFAQILLAVSANPNLANEPDYLDFYQYMNSMILMYDAMSKPSPSELLETFKQAFLVDGVDTFVIDNIMTLGVDRGDMSEQAQVADKVRMFVAEFPVHVHLVGHPRKPPTEIGDRMPTQTEIRGPAEWGDMPNNVISVWRDRNKSAKIAEMISNNFTDVEIDKFFKSTPCGKFAVQKQRATGETPMCDFWFHPETKRFMHQPGRPYPMYSEKPWLIRVISNEEIQENPQ